MVGKRLRQARLLARMSQTELSARLRKLELTTSAAKISEYERGKTFPDASFLLRACSVLGISPSYLHFDPEVAVSWKGFRRRARLGKTERERIKLYARELVELQLELRELLESDSDPNVPRFAVDSLEEADLAAGQLREAWDVGDRPLDNLVQLAEDHNVIVVGWDADNEFFDGLSGWCEGLPVTVINTRFPTDRLRLTMAHELGHLVMDTECACEDDEALAFRFAAALLVPAEHARRELGDDRTDIGWGELITLKRKYGISMQAGLRRARDLAIIDEQSYRESMIEFSRRGWRKGEPVHYVGDESPLELERMAQLALSKGLISWDRFLQAGVSPWQPEPEPQKSDHLTVRDLLAMPEKERNSVMEQAFALAAEEGLYDSDSYFEEDFEEYAFYESE